MEIRNAVCLVTGAGSGLGLATATLLERLGAKVAWLDLNWEALEQMPSDGKRPILSVDVTQDDAMTHAFSKIARELGTPRVLVNCADVLSLAKVTQRTADGRVLPCPLECFSRVIEVNIVGTFNAIRLFAAAASQLPELPGGERGVIVNTASIAAEDALSGQAAYGASKGGVSSMTLPLARELARFGIRAVSICPGVFHAATYEDNSGSMQESVNHDTAFPRRPGAPEEFAQLVEAVIRNPMLNGTSIRIDGASRMREPRFTLKSS